eukprot:g1730.t1
MLKHTDPATLMEISEEAVTSSGIGIYRQKNRALQGSVSTAGPSPNQPTERPDQLRQKFAQSLKAEIRGKDKELLKEVAALEEDEADQRPFDVQHGSIPVGGPASTKRSVGVGENRALLPRFLATAHRVRS